MVENKVKKEFAGKEILFINNPHLCGAYRDKLTVIKKLAQFHIPQPRLYSISTIKGIQDKLISGHGLFLKPRYGSMGKGITFLSRFDWQTNFIFRDSKIISRRSDHGWKFRDILIQEAVDPPILNGDKVDLRIYTFFDKVIYVYPRKNSLDKVTTNISQGGHGAPGALRVLPEYMVSRAKREALRVSKALNISLAGIDIVPDRNSKEVFVIDVNVFSGFPKRRTFDLAARLAGELGQLREGGKLFFKNSDRIQCRK